MEVPWSKDGGKNLQHVVNSRLLRNFSFAAVIDQEEGRVWVALGKRHNG